VGPTPEQTTSPETKRSDIHGGPSVEGTRAATIGLAMLSCLFLATAPWPAVASSARTAPPNTVSAVVAIDGSKLGAVISRDVIGGESAPEVQNNSSPWQRATFASVPLAFATYGDDFYHWQINALCSQTKGQPPQPSLIDSSLDSFEKYVAQPLRVDVLVHVPLGTNPTCTKGANPDEAAAWVDHENNVMHYGIKYWELGFEPYAPDNGDFLTPPLTENGPEYAKLSKAFSAAMKAKDPSIKVGVAISPGYQNTATETFDATTLAEATYDFIIVSLGPITLPVIPPPDAELIDDGPVSLDAVIAHVRAELAKAGKPNTPIFADDFTSQLGSFEDQQTVSIVDGLYTGEALGEVLENGIAGTVWPTITGPPCNIITPAKGVYGWQNFASDDLFSFVKPAGCTANIPPLGTPYPSGRAYQLAALFARGGNHMLGTTVVNAAPGIRAYGATQGGSGYSAFLFNLNESTAAHALVQLSNVHGTAFAATSTTYGRAQYDRSRNGVWSPPLVQKLGTVGRSFDVTLPEWSMTVIQLVRT